MKKGGLRVLLVGSGGRESAYDHYLMQSDLVETVFFAPGNGGTPTTRRVNIKAAEVNRLLAFAQEMKIDWVVVGPEAPLVKGGIADKATALGIPIFGPTTAAARLEGSKVFAKRLCKKYGIPTSDYFVFKDYDDARERINNWDEGDLPIIVKIDGLAGGKGVKVAFSKVEAEHAVREMLVKRKFGEDGGNEIVIERFVSGPEYSVMGICDGENVILLPVARDYKRLTPDANAPNTGGMGAIAPVIGSHAPELLEIKRTFFMPVLKAMKDAGTPYHGILYAGLKGPSLSELKLIEYNCRGGDPEIQVALPLFTSDPVELMWAARKQGGLAEVGLPTFQTKFAVCVNKVAPGYPDKPKTGGRITGLGEARKTGMVFCAGVEKNGDDDVVSDGRVVSSVGLGYDPLKASNEAYRISSIIDFDGAYERPDIGL